MRLFISYARVDKFFAYQVANLLQIHKVWLDERLYAGQDWWNEILRRLDWCEGFIHLISSASLESQYCQRELKIAQKLGRPIFPILIEPNVAISQDLGRYHYVDFSAGVSPEGVASLLNAIALAEREVAQKGMKKIIPPNQAHEISRNTQPVSMSDPAVAIERAADAIQSEQFDEAVLILEQLKAHNIRPRWTNLDALLEVAKQGLKQQTAQREVATEYRNISVLLKRPRTREVGLEALVKFLTDHPEYDPEGLRDQYLDSVQGTVNGNQPLVSRPRFHMPMLEWIDIPAGELHIPGMFEDEAQTERRESLFVDAFRISKYPVTNAQYQLFLDDPQGYRNPRWWDFSASAMEWRRLNPEPVPSRWPGENLPRETVTWYEAMAFTRWLSEKTGLDITLPLRQQWQRAARGDEDRIFAFGNVFETHLANTSESGIKMTTMVTRYEHAPSPFGVVDMAGNTWEWCLNNAYDDLDITTNSLRAVQGGSFFSRHDRAQTSFHLALAPDVRFATIGFRLVCLTRQGE